MAHNGVLFLDELPEFKKNVLEVLRQPLEDGMVTIARAASSLSFPARFIMVAAMNPCPCGYLGDPQHECQCSPLQIRRYENKISGPLLDRIDIHIEVPAVPVKDLTEHRDGEDSAAIKKRVNRARDIQKSRYQRQQHLHCNGQMGAREIKKHCMLDAGSLTLLEKAVERLGLSARAYHRILKIARTIADLDGSEKICSEHIGEAIQYRRLEQKQ